MSPELIVAIGLALVALGAGLIRAFKTVQDARGRVDKLVKSRASQLERIRKAARTSLQLKRSIKDAEKRRAACDAEVEAAVAGLQTASNIDHRLYVLDDRRTKADQSWIVVVGHPTYAQAISVNALPSAVEDWRRGRRFLVFALDGGKAREKASARYHERQGYQIISVELQPTPKSKTKML